MSTCLAMEEMIQVSCCIIYQARLDSQGLPFYRKMAKGLGGKELIFLWIAKSFDSQEFLTDVQLTHADPADQRFA